MKTIRRYGMTMIRKHGALIDSRWLPKGPSKLGGWVKPPASKGAVENRSAGFLSDAPAGFKWPREYHDAGTISWSKQEDPNSWDATDDGDAKPEPLTIKSIAESLTKSHQRRRRDKAF